MSKLGIPDDVGDGLDRLLDAFGTVYKIKPTNPDRFEAGRVIYRTWRDELASVMRSETDPGPIVAVHPGEADLDVPFSGPEGPPILVWTERNVYFPVTAGGVEMLEVAPRNPIEG